MAAGVVDYERTVWGIAALLDDHCQRVKAIDPRRPNPFLHKGRNVQSHYSSGIFQSPSNADSLESC